MDTDTTRAMDTTKYMDTLDMVIMELLDMDSVLNTTGVMELLIMDNTETQLLVRD